MKTHQVLLVCAVALALPSSLVSEATADLISVANAGFEAVMLPDGGFTRPDVSEDPIPGWLVLPMVTDTLADGGTFNPTTAQYPNEAPEGQNVAFSSWNGSDTRSPAVIVQLLEATLQANTTYTLQIKVGRRLDNVFPGYLVLLSAGQSALAFDLNSLEPAAGTFLTSTVTFTTGADHPELGQPLAIWMTRYPTEFGVGQVNFDDVRLDASPAP